MEPVARVSDKVLSTILLPYTKSRDSGFFKERVLWMSSIHEPYIIPFCIYTGQIPVKSSSTELVLSKVQNHQILCTAKVRLTKLYQKHSQPVPFDRTARAGKQNTKKYCLTPSELGERSVQSRRNLPKSVPFQDLVYALCTACTPYTRRTQDPEMGPILGGSPDFKRTVLRA